MVSRRRGGKKQSRKQSRKQRKQNKRQSKRNQRGGSCAAMPLNRELFGQRGGMAPFASLDNGFLINDAARVQAQTSPLDAAINELPSVIPRQSGGRRNRRTQRQRNQRQRQSKRQRQQRQQRQQRGGMYDIHADTMLLPRGTNIGANPQFSNESQVNNLYNEYSGPQGPHTR